MNKQQQLELKNFVEEVGLYFERLSLPRMAGRILGWLLICDPPHQSLNELAEALEASKASISNTTRMLIEMGLIERISLAGYRYDHYRLKPDAWYELTQRRATQLAAIRRLAERGLKLLEGQEPAVRARLQEMRTLYAFFEQEFPALLERFEESQHRQRAEPEVSG